MRIRKPTFAVAALAAAVLTLGPGVADAKKHLPPGSSQLDQYIETLPGPGDDRPAGSIAGGKHDILPPPTAQQLQNAGGAGQATANLAEASAPEPTSGGGREGSGAGRAQPGTGPAASGAGQVTKALLGSNSGGGGMGVWLPLILGAIAVVAVGYVVRSRLQNRPAS